MRVFKRFEDLARLRHKKAVVTLGTFDGFHKGHQQVIRQTVREAKKRRAAAVVLTYARHPLATLAPSKTPPLMTSLNQKLRLLEDMGVDAVVLIPFTHRFANIEAKDFIQKKLCRWLRVQEFCIGPDTTFGKGAQGDANLLKLLGKKWGFRVRAVPRVKVAGRPVSSSRVRDRIRSGKLSRAAQFLGRPYSIQGKVVRGDMRGRRIGFPTANLEPENELLPPCGVYAIRALWKGKSYPGVLNLGYRPTFRQTGRPKLSLEAHLLNFRKKLYGCNLELQFIQRLRPEKKFKGPKHLATQIQKDISKAQRLFSL